MIQSGLFQHGEDIPWEEAGPGIVRRIYGYGEQVMMVKVKFTAGAVGGLHEHHHAQVTYVESGKFEMTIGDEKRIIGKGDGYYVPPHVVHGCVCLEPGILIDVFSPFREDFLK